MAKSKGICKDCKSYDPNEEYPGYHGGKCKKGFDVFAGMGAHGIMVRETDTCTKFGKKGK